MRLIGLLVCRDAGWILPRTLPAMLKAFDLLVVGTHDCRDDTEEIVEAHADKGIVSTSFDNDEWNEAEFRQELLAIGTDCGGTHFAVIDSDEQVCGPMLSHLRPQAEKLNPGECLSLPWVHCWRSFDKYRADKSRFGMARVPFIFADAPHLKYAPKPDGYQLHCRVPDGVTMKQWGERDKGEGVFHFQHVEWDRCIAKQHGYIEQELRRWPGRRPEAEIRRQYLATLDETGLVARDVPAEWRG